MTSVGYRDGPCANCPWLVTNHGRRHPNGWFRASNRRRLWAGLRTGEAPGMTCHPTDPNNPVPDGHPKPSGDTEVRECAGALALLQLELRRLEDSASYSAYQADAKARGVRPVTIEGAFAFVARVSLPPPIGLADTDNPMPDYRAQLDAEQLESLHQ